MTAPVMQLPGSHKVQRFISPANLGLGLNRVEYKKDNGVYVVQREAVFRTGSFRDSWGEMTTWDSLHAKQIVENFNHLRNTNVFSEVPVRDGHAGFIVNNLPGNGRVVGWHTGLVTEKAKSPIDGEEYDYIFADYEITEPDAAEKRQRGTWRNRSAEILRYVTNNEAEYYPVWGGFAFVDIPAVEGLNFSRDTSAPENGVRYFVMRETTVTQPASGNPTQPTAPAAPAQPPAPAPHMFSINGQATSDYAAVQRHISALENAQNEARNTARTAYVNSLAQSGRILGNEENLKSMTEFAMGLTDAQFETWSAGYAAQPQPAMFGQHNVASATGAAPIQGAAVFSGGAAAPAGNDEIEIAKETVRHLRGSMSEDDVKKTASFAKLVAAGVERA